MRTFGLGSFTFIISTLLVCFSQAQPTALVFKKAPELATLKLSVSSQKVVQYVLKHALASDISIIADKSNSMMYVMKGDTLIAANPFLQGITRDDQFPGGSMEAAYKLAVPTVRKMVSPAGKFPLTKTINDPDYGTSLTFAMYKDWRIAIHQVYLGAPEQRRQQRLDSASEKDNAITSGCLNVDKGFYFEVLDKLAISPNSFVYVIPNDVSLMHKFLPLDN